jgi:hypothetical protein
VFYNFYPENRAVCDIMWKKYDEARQTTDDSIIWCMRFACWVINDAHRHKNVAKLYETDSLTILF